MLQVARHYLWIVPVSLCVFFFNLGAAGLFDEDEPKNAACAYEMLVRGDWVVPSFNHELRPEKPVLLYWLMMLAYRVFGVTEFAARFWSAALALGTVLVTYHLGRRLFQAEVGLWSAIAMSTALMFGVVARAATPDATLIFFVTLGMYAFACSVGRPGANPWHVQVPVTGAGMVAPPACVRFAPRHYGWWGLASVAWGLAVLTKGPIGVLLPLASLTTFLLLVELPASTIRSAAPIDWFERLTIWFVRLCDIVSPQRVRNAIWAWRPIVTLSVVAAITLPWYVAVGMQTEGRWLTGFLGQHNVGRFLSPMENHSGPFFYYFLAVLIGFFPWSVFLAPCLVDACRRLRNDHEQRAGYVFLTCWAGVWILFFTLARTKLPNYVLPAYPAFAVLTGAFIQHWVQDPQVIGQRLIRWSLAALALAGVIMLVGLSVAGTLVLAGELALGLVGLLPIVGAAVAFWAAQRERTMHAAGAIGMTAVVLSCLLFGVVAVRVSRHQSSATFMAATQVSGTPSATIASFDYFEPSLVFYARRRVERLQYAEVLRYFEEPSERYLLVFEDQLEELWPTLPPGVSVLARQSRFLRGGQIVLLGREPVLNVAAETSRELR